MLLLALTLCPVALTSGCASECPSGGQTGSCDLSATMPDNTLGVTPLQLVEGCDYLPPEACSGSPRYTCGLGGGSQHSYAFAVIADRQSWEALAAHSGTACTPPGLPANWSNTFLVLARGQATGSSDSSVNFSRHVRGSGTPVIKVDFDFTFESDCDCQQLVNLALVVSTNTQPDVCLEAAATCK
jgi:hypothetical protein